MKNMNLNKSHSIFREKLETTSFHAIPNIIRTKSLIVKIAWILLLIGSCSLCSIVILKSVSGYLEYEVTTRTRFYKNEYLEFPGVTICNFDPFVSNFSIKYLAHFLRNNRNISNYFKINNQTYIDDLQLVNDVIRKSKNNDFLYFSLDQASRENSSLRNKLGYDFDEMFLSCKFKSENCNKNEFKLYYDYYYGNCYEFNNIFPYQSLNRIGSDSGLELELLVGKLPNYLPFYASYGISVYIYNQSLGLTDFDKYEISNGFYTKIGIKKLFYNKLPNPYSDCVDSNYFRDQNFTNQFSYSMQSCFSNCLQRLNYINCNCYDLKSVCKDCQTSNFCFRNDELSCIGNLNNYNICHENCRTECNSQYYSFKISAKMYPTELTRLKLIGKSKILKELSLKNGTIDRNVLKLNIYLDSFDYEMITENPSILLTDLIANVGGTLGLFLGNSVLSFFEIFEPFFEIIIFKIKSKTRS